VFFGAAGHRLNNRVTPLLTITPHAATWEPVALRHKACLSRPFH